MIEVVVTEMEKRAIQGDKTHGSIIARSSLALQFVSVMERTCPPTDVEIQWYQERNKFLSKKVIIFVTRMKKSRHDMLGAYEASKRLTDIYDLLSNLCSGVLFQIAIFPD